MNFNKLILIAILVRCIVSDGSSFTAGDIYEYYTKMDHNGNRSGYVIDNYGDKAPMNKKYFIVERKK